MQTSHGAPAAHLLALPDVSVTVMQEAYETFKGNKAISDSTPDKEAAEPTIHPQPLTPILPILAATTRLGHILKYLVCSDAHYLVLFGKWHANCEHLFSHQRKDLDEVGK